MTHGKLLTWDPHRVFERTWGTDVLRWELELVENGTQLTLTTWLGRDVDSAMDAAAGYHVCLDQLIELLDEGSTGPLVDADVHRWEQEYAEAVAGVGCHRVRLGQCPGSGTPTRFSLPFPRRVEE